MLETGLSQSNSSETSDKEDAVIVAIRKSHEPLSFSGYF